VTVPWIVERNSATLRVQGRPTYSEIMMIWVCSAPCLSFRIDRGFVQIHFRVVGYHTKKSNQLEIWLTVQRTGWKLVIATYSDASCHIRLARLKMTGLINSWLWENPKHQNYSHGEMEDVILRVLVRDVLPVSLSHTRFRPKGVLVIARRGF